MRRKALLPHFIFHVYGCHEESNENPLLGFPIAIFFLVCKYLASEFAHYVADGRNPSVNLTSRHLKPYAPEFLVAAIASSFFRDFAFYRLELRDPRAGWCRVATDLVGVRQMRKIRTAKIKIGSWARDGLSPNNP